MQVCLVQALFFPDDDFWFVTSSRKLIPSKKETRTASTLGRQLHFLALGDLQIKVKGTIPRESYPDLWLAGYLSRF